MLKLDALIWSLLSALGIGLLIGTERERRKGTGPRRSAAGLRTFALASLTGAVSVIAGGAPLLAVVATGIFGLTALAYWRGPNVDPGLTTEIALVSAVLLGGLAVTRPEHAAGVAVVIAIILNARAALHRFVRSVLSDGEIRDALIFAAATLIVLPLLPDQQIGPFAALNPRVIWTIVILVMAIGALGHIAVRLAGPRYGLPVAGLASGFVSGTATVLAMGRRTADASDLFWPASAGAVLSSIGTIVQLAALLAATNIEVLHAAAIPLSLSGAAAIVYGIVFSLFALRKKSGTVEERGQAFSPWTALAFAALLSVILLASQVMNEWFGGRGVSATAAIAGLASVDPAAISAATLVTAGKFAATDAMIPILVAFSTNTITKAVLCLSVGSRGYALRVIPGLTLVALAAWIGWWWTSS
ncbi:MAG: MgtC/SapB family protein [Beijerinckiaceae bacterium]